MKKPNRAGLMKAGAAMITMPIPAISCAHGLAPLFETSVDQGLLEGFQV